MCYSLQLMLTQAMSLFGCLQSSFTFSHFLLFRPLLALGACGWSACVRFHVLQLQAEHAALFVQAGCKLVCGIVCVGFID